MRRVFVAVLMLTIAVPAFAQQTPATPVENETVTIKKSELTSEQLAKVQHDELKEKLGNYKEYAEMGRGVGLAVGESLKAVKDVAVDFSKTDVGRFTMFIIAWKVMAKDVIDMGDTIFGYIVGIPFLFLGSLVMLWSYRRQCLPRRICIEKTKEGKKWAIIAPNGERVDVGDASKPHYVEGRAIWAICHYVGYALFFLASCTLIFGC